MAPHRIGYNPHIIGVVGRLADFGQRIAESPPAGWVFAGLASLLAATGHDPFTWAWVLLIAFSAGDHVIGVSRAREVGVYVKAEAARGRRSKIITVLLMVGFRMVEGFATGYGLLNLAALLRFIHLDAAANSPVIQHGGIVSAVITILLAFDELGSIYGHRLADGGSRILLAELAFNGARAAQRFVLGGAAKAVEGWAGEEAGKEFHGSVAAIRRIDETGHARAHPEDDRAPARRHYDAALEEMAERPPPQGLDDA